MNWSSPSDIVLEDDPSKVDSGDTLDDTMDAEPSKSVEKVLETRESILQPTGKVVGIINRKWIRHTQVMSGSTALPVHLRSGRNKHGEAWPRPRAGGHRGRTKLLLLLVMSQDYAEASLRIMATNKDYYRR